MKKRLLSAFLALCMLLGLLPSTVYAAKGTQQFTDVNEGDWFSEAVQYVYQNGLMYGAEDTTFAPNSPITRGQIVTILHRLEGTPSSTGSSFTDVPDGEYYANAVAWANTNGIMSGYGDGLFGPADPITREQLASTMYRYARHKGYDTTIKGNVATFSDGGMVSSYAVDAVNWAIGVGILSGMGDNLFAPQGNATRAQAAAILMRFCESSKVTTPTTTQATQYTVTFMYNYGTQGVYDTVTVDRGQAIGSIKNPSRSGYDFSGWYTAASGGSYFNIRTSKVTSNMTLYAHWSVESSSDGGSFDGGYVPEPGPTPTPPASYTVKFESNCSETVADQTVSPRGYATHPDILEKPGYQFAGWFTTPDETDLTNRFKFSDTPITSDIILYAIWVNMTMDSDNDGLPDELEAYVGTDIHSVDTDGDGLTDYQEVVVLGTNPLAQDTDANGVSDYDEDYDGDGITNGEEFSLGTDPVRRDSDNDGLSDYDEIYNHFTSATNPDSDKDGASDGWEVENGFDPLVYNRSFPITISTEAPSVEIPVTAGVKVELNGKSVTTLNIQPVGYTDDPLLSPSIAGYLGSAYDFSCEGNIESAELVFAYDTSLGTIGTDFQPRIYYYNEEEGSFEELKNQTVSNGKITAQVTHFSKYILLNKVEFDKIWDTEIKPPMTTGDGENAVLDVVFVIDYSASMDRNDPKKIFADLSKEFVAKLRDGIDQAAVVKFIRRASVVSALTSDKEALYLAIDSIKYDSGYGSYSGTDGSAGLHAALELLSASDSDYKYAIFITDGEDNGYSYSYDSLISSAITQGVVVYTVGMGDASESVLRNVASSTGGVYYHASATDNVDSDNIFSLDDVYDEIASETIDLTSDSNGDGIPDYYNDLIYSGDLVLSNGSVEFSGIDFNFDADGNPSDDWDGDGLKNGEELKIVQRGSKVVLVMKSNPLLEHSDMDGVSDYNEVRRGTDPLVYQVSERNVNLAQDDDYYYYEDAVKRYEENWFLNADTKFLSAIYGVWNKDELYRDIMIDYFSKYGEATYIENLETEATRKTMLETLNGIVSNLKTYWSSPRSEIKNIMKLISEINGTADTETINYLLFSTYTEVITEVYSIDPSLGTVTLSTYSMSEETIRIINLNSVSDKIGKISKGLSYISYGLDVADTIAEFSKVSANAEAFEKNIDILKQIATYSSDNHAKDAANAIMNKLAGGYSSEIAAVGGDLLEVGGKQLISTLAKKSPYVLAIIVVRDGIDIITGISKDLKQYYQMTTYERMAKAINALIDDVTWNSGGYCYVSYENVNDFTRLMSNLLQVRILGEKKYCDFCEDDGIIGWFTDNSDTEKAIEEQVKWIKSIADALGLHLASGL